MKTALSLVLAALGLAGCAVVPVPVAPRHAYVYAPPPAVVVVRPYRWHRRWY